MQETEKNVQLSIAQSGQWSSYLAFFVNFRQLRLMIFDSHLNNFDYETFIYGLKGQNMSELIQK